MKQTHILRLRTNKLRVAVAKEGKAHFAEKVGIHLSTLRQLLDDKWQRVERKSIEAICDHLEWSLDDLFVLEPDRFWQPFEETEYRILRGVVLEKKTKLPLEEESKSTVIRYLQSIGCTGGFAEGLTTEKDILECARNFNCLVIGAHPSNQAWEYLIAHLFEARPYDTKEENRNKIPARFVLNGRKRSAFFQSPQPGLGERTGIGVYSEHHQQLLVEVDRWTPKEFQDVQTLDARDAALVIVANNPFGTTKQTKLIMLSGCSKIGTMAAVDAVLRDFRDLQPQQERGIVWGVLDVRFRKLASGDTRELTTYAWRYRSDGRDPIAFKP